MGTWLGAPAGVLGAVRAGGELARVEAELPRQPHARAGEDPQRPRLDLALLSLDPKRALLEVIRAKKRELGIGAGTPPP
jgi:hypothetical protein